MPASLAVRAHWSVSTSVALKKETSLTPGVHSLPEKVLKLQQMNMPNRRSRSSLTRAPLGVAGGGDVVSAECAGKVAQTIPMVAAKRPETNGR